MTKATIGRVAVAALAVGAMGLLAGGAEPLPRAAQKANQAERGKALFLRHCASCHGEQGDGNGIAARFVYPKPRNFQEGKFKLVSTANRIPTDDDLLQAISRGMPGSAMLPFGHLPEADRAALVAHVRMLTRAGIQQRLKKAYDDAGDDVDAKQLEREALRQTTPGDLVQPPKEFPAEDQASIQRGRTFYMASCAQCHGETGRGEGGKDQRDDDGSPTKPRDFTQGIFKGTRDVPSLYRRMLIGMPGTPMPATTHLKSADLGDMAHYIRSLAPADAQAKVEHKRQTLVAKRVAKIDDAAWAQAPTSFIVVAPLWWRDFQNPELRVQALHDGQHLAFRLTWKDSTKNDVIPRVEDFEDMASVQLCDDAQEPFIGMGAHGFGPVDLWLWKASGGKDQTVARHQLDEYPFDTTFYAEFLKRMAPSKTPPPDYRTARAAGNQNAAGNTAAGSSSLTAAGPGTITFRPRGSQLVATSGVHRDGNWSVTLTRPLAVKPEGGVTLASGKKLFIAFALWDGAARDRNGQKQISIWHELAVE